MEYLFPAVDKHGRLIDIVRPAQHRAVYRLLRKAPVSMSRRGGAVAVVRKLAVILRDAQTGEFFDRNASAIA
ncbi:hypothetical protein [Mesorhizobium sp. M0011]|uniref:hypothetical protein n=1 Tax=Mesorhizobium sp. M0011 TaxID=2956839 RepID=UPI00333D19D2